MIDLKAIAAQAGALVVERSGGTDYGCMDLDLEHLASLIEKESIKLCRDMFNKGSVSWNLLNDRYISCTEESRNE